MSTFTDRPNTALLVIDVQNNVVAAAHDRDAVVANIVALVDRARSERRSGHLGAALDDEMPIGSDPGSTSPS